MELTELKSMWNTHNTEVSQQITLNKKLLKESSVRKIKSSLTAFKFENYSELIMCIVFIPFLMRFNIAHLDTLRFFIPGLVLLLVCFGSILWNIFNLTQAFRLNYKHSIAFLQKKMQQLQLSERYERNTLYVLIPLFYFCFVIILPKHFVGIDMYQYFNEYWAWNFIATILIAISIVWLLKKFPDQGIKQSSEFLMEIEEFEKEG